MTLWAKGWRIVATGLLALAVLGACGNGDDADTTADATATSAAEESASDGGDTGAGEAATAPSGSACDTISDAEAASVFGGPVTKEGAGGSSCNITSESGTFAVIKFESGTLEEAAETIEEGFDTQTEPVSGIGEGAFKFEASGVSGLMVLQDGRIANIAAGGGFGLEKMKELALAMFND